MNKEITELLADYDNAWNARDAVTYSNLFLEDATAIFFTLDGNKIELLNRTAILDFYIPQFQGLAARPNVHHHTQITRTQQISNGLLNADGDAIITDVKAETGETVTLRKWAVVFTLVNKEKQWRIFSLRAFERPLT